MTLGAIVILQGAGIDLTSLNVLVGAFGVGLGFGLQNITSNFFSGLILLFERPIESATGSRLQGASEKSRRSRHAPRPSSPTRTSRSSSEFPVRLGTRDELEPTRQADCLPDSFLRVARI